MKNPALASPSPETFAYSAVFESPLELHLAFFRDVSADVDFLLGLFERLMGRKAQSALEVQCGPAYYARALALRGLSCTAIDTREDFLSFARSLVAPAPVEFAREHPCNLSPRGPYDLVLLPLDSMAYFPDDAAVHAFLASASRSMHDQSLLVIEANHPKDVGYIDYGVIYGGTAPSHPGRRVRAEWGVNAPRFDLLTGRVDTVIRITNQTGESETVREIKSAERVYFPRELTLLTQQSPLSICGFFGGYADHTLGWDDAVQVIALRKRTP